MKVLTKVEANRESMVVLELDARDLSSIGCIKYSGYGSATVTPDPAKTLQGIIKAHNQGLATCIRDRDSLSIVKETLRKVEETLEKRRKLVAQDGALREEVTE